MILNGFGPPSWLPFSTKIDKNGTPELGGSRFFHLRFFWLLGGTPGLHFSRFGCPRAPIFMIFSWFWKPIFLFFWHYFLSLHLLFSCLLLVLFPFSLSFVASFFLSLLLPSFIISFPPLFLCFLLFSYLPSFVHSLLPFSVCSRLAWLAVGWVADGLVGSREAIRI